MVQNAMKESNPTELEVLVDYECAVENVTRYGKDRGFTVTVTEDDGEYTLILKK